MIAPFCSFSAGGLHEMVRTVLSVTERVKFCGVPLGAASGEILAVRHKTWKVNLCRLACFWCLKTEDFSTS